MWCKFKLLDSLMYMYTEVEKLTICEELFLFIVCGLYLYLQDDRQMCLVDTRIGVASGEALFLYSAFCFGVLGRENSGPLRRFTTVVPVTLSYQNVRSDKLKMSISFLFFYFFFLLLCERLHLFDHFCSCE